MQVLKPLQGNCHFLAVTDAKGLFDEAAEPPAPPLSYSDGLVTPPQPPGSSLTNTPFITRIPPSPPHGGLTSSESQMNTAGAAPAPAAPHQTASVVVKSITISEIQGCYFTFTPPW